jgi:drug/metabolite transporter (DMT)-like permease
MSLYALLLIVGCSLCWSGLDWARKTIATEISPIPFLIALSAGQALVLTPWLLSGGPLTSQSGYWLPATGSILLNIAGNWLFMRAVAISPFSLTIPYLALTPVFTALLAMPTLREIPAPLQLAGIALTVSGALTLNPVSAEGRFQLLTTLWRERGSAYMVLVALLWSLASPLDKLALQQASPAFHGLVLSAGVPLGFLAILLVQRRLGSLREVARRPGVLALAIAFGTSALYLQLSAMQLVFVGLVEAIKRVVELAMAAVIGRAFFREPITGRKAIALALMAVGVVLILVKT